MSLSPWRHQARTLILQEKGCLSLQIAEMEVPTGGLNSRLLGLPGLEAGSQRSGRGQALFSLCPLWGPFREGTDPIMGPCPQDLITLEPP